MLNELIFFCFFSLSSGLCSVLAGKYGSVKSPVFSDGYIAKGTLYIPYAEIREPFFAWYDKSEGRSRIDYYGGEETTTKHADEWKTNFKMNNFIEFN